MDSFYFVDSSRERRGPYSAEDLVGLITPDTLVWKEGLDSWTPANQVPELVSYFSQATATHEPVVEQNVGANSQSNHNKLIIALLGVIIVALLGIIFLMNDCSGKNGGTGQSGESASSSLNAMNQDEATVSEPSAPDVKTYTVNGVSFKMVEVQGGTFTMGGTSEQGGEANANELPTHQVTLSSYYIGMTEVTQELWEAVMGSNPSSNYGMQNPVENVSYFDCIQFVNELNQKTGESFSLPSEAQWEFAARGGLFSKGYKYSGSNDLNSVAWYDRNSHGKSQPVASKAPNELGIYDMSGNLMEWCMDSYGTYKSEPQTNPDGNLGESSELVRRGGSFIGDANRCRVSNRYYYNSNEYFKYLGLRLVR